MSKEDALQLINKLTKRMQFKHSISIGFVLHEQYVEVKHGVKTLFIINFSNQQKHHNEAIF